MRYRCESCGREWDYPLKMCIFCRKPLTEVDESHYTVLATSKVFVPSVHHPITPYHVLLLKNDSGSFRFMKTMEPHDVGDTIYAKGASKSKSHTVGVIGSGITGKGLVETIASSGHNVIFKGRSEASLKKAMEIIEKRLSKMHDDDKVEAILGRISMTTRYEPLSEAELVIESVVEDIEVKKSIFRELDTICPPETILASNTSSLLISEISEGVRHPERVVGMHFFNPIPKMQLVEVIRTEKTSPSVVKRVHEFASEFNKTTVSARDTSGFIVNRLLFIMINEACTMLDEGVSSVEDIDKAMRLGANHPMGPFQLADLIGLDLCLEIIENLSNLGAEKFKPSRTLREYVEKGLYGRKSGKGFYDY